MLTCLEGAQAIFWILDHCKITLSLELSASICKLDSPWLLLSVLKARGSSWEQLSRGCSVEDGSEGSVLVAYLSGLWKIASFLTYILTMRGRRINRTSFMYCIVRLQGRVRVWGVCWYSRGWVAIDQAESDPVCPVAVSSESEARSQAYHCSCCGTRIIILKKLLIQSK